MSSSLNDETTSTASSSPYDKPRQGNLNLVLSAVALSSLMTQLGSCSLEQLEKDCRWFAKKTTVAVIELGKRLLLIKTLVEHGQWMDTLKRIGIGQSLANKVMRVTIRLINAGGLHILLDSANSPGQLFELMILDDDELKQLDNFETVRGVSQKTLRTMTVKQLRKTLKENAPADTQIEDKAKVIEEKTAKLEPAEAIANVATSQHLTKPQKCRLEVGDNQFDIKKGDLVRDIQVKRYGRVFEIYTDGTVKVWWEATKRVLVPERIEISLLRPLDGKESSPQPAENSDSLVMPPEVAPILGEPAISKGASTHLFEASETYPAVYSLTPGKFNGCDLSILQYEGRAWLMLEEVAAVVGETSERVSEIEEILGKFFDLNFPAGHFAKVRFASSSLVARILDEHAVRFCEEALGAAFVTWFSAQTSAPAEPVASVPAKSGLTLKQTLNQLSNVNFEIHKMLYLVEAQIKAVDAIVSEWQTGKEAYHINPLVEIARKLIDPWEDLIDRQEEALSSLTRKIFKNPDAGTFLPESVWLALVAELADEHANGLSNDNMCQLADIVDSMEKHGTPEVEQAVHVVEAYVDRNGATLYDHEKSGKVAFAWNHGVEQSRQQKVRESVIAH